MAQSSHRADLSLWRAYGKLIRSSKSLNWIGDAAGTTLGGMNEAAGAVTGTGALIPTMAAAAPGAIRPAWEPSNRRPTTRDSLTAGVFMLFYLAAYAVAGYLGVMFIEWAWMRIFG